MRRRLAVLAALPLLFAAACGGQSGGEGGATAASPAALTVTGEVGKKPTVTFPEGEPPATSSAKVVVEGEGEPIPANAAVVANLTVYNWDGKSNAMGGSTYDAGTPEVVPLTDQLPKVVKDGFSQVRIGGRFYAVVAADSYTKEQLDQAKAQGADVSAAQVFVVDVVDAPKKLAASGKTVDFELDGVELKHPGEGKAPELSTKTDMKAPKKLVAETVIEGGGEKVKSGQHLLVQYVGKIWGTDKEFDSSWSRGQPAIFQIGTGKVIKGWDEGLVGRPVGSRVLLSIPPKLGYGEQGQGEIKGTDTLVFAVDILAAYDAA